MSLLFWLLFILPQRAPANPCLNPSFAALVQEWPAASGMTRFRYTVSEPILSIALDLQNGKASFTSARGCVLTTYKDLRR